MLISVTVVKLLDFVVQSSNLSNSFIHFYIGESLTQGYFKIHTYDKILLLVDGSNRLSCRFG